MALTQSVALGISDYADRLSDAKKSLLSYKNNLSVFWRAEETKQIVASVDAAISDIDKAIALLGKGAGEVKRIIASEKAKERRADVLSDEIERLENEAQLMKEELFGNEPIGLRSIVGVPAEKREKLLKYDALLKEIENKKSALNELMKKK